MSKKFKWKVNKNFAQILSKLYNKIINKRQIGRAHV